MYLIFCMIWILSCIFVSWLVGVIVVIYVSCGLYCNPAVMLPLVLIPLASRVWFFAHVVSEGVSESISCGFRRVAGILRIPVRGRHSVLAEYVNFWLCTNPLMRLLWVWCEGSFQGSREEDDIIWSRRVRSLSLGMPPWFIPAYFKKTQSSKLGDAQGIPFIINNLSGHL